VHLDRKKRAGSAQPSAVLSTRAWPSAERPSVLFDLATERLLERKILLPGVITLTRLVAAVQDRAAQRLWRRLAALHDAEVRQRLEDLAVVPVGGRQTPLDRLRTAPVPAGAPALVDALHRLDEARALGARRVDLSGFPPGRLKVLARYAAAARAQAIVRMPEHRRTRPVARHRLSRHDWWPTAARCRVLPPRS
jgi:hypothetical protein